MHKPIRVLLEEAGDLIQQLKPCFMMSPLSVAKYMDPESMDFDVVIFDEASQVRPEDALGTIMRGSQLVMFGDTKQLPPTSFFDQIVDDQDSEDQWEFNVQDAEELGLRLNHLPDTTYDRGGSSVNREEALS